MKTIIIGVVGTLLVSVLTIQTPVLEVGRNLEPIVVDVKQLPQGEFKTLKKAELVKTPVEDKKPVEGVKTANASVSGVESLIVKWAKHYGVSSELLLRVAKCESGLNPLAQNKGYYAGGGHPSGVFQFLPETFNRYSSRAGISGDVWDANDNVRVAAYAFSVGGSSEWACK